MNTKSYVNRYREMKEQYGPEVAMASLVYQFRMRYFHLRKSIVIAPETAILDTEIPNDDNLLNFENPANKVNLKTRILNLKNPNTIRVAILFPALDHGTFRYRAYHVWQILRDDAKYSCSFFYLNEMKELTQIADSIDLLINVRTEWNDDIENLINLLHQKNRKVTYDIDDLIYDLDYFILISKQIYLLPETYDQWVAKIARKYLSLMKSDYVQTTNEFLAEKLRMKCKKKVFVFPNTVNIEQVTASEKLLQEKRNKENQIIRIGYFSGTNSHNNDFKLVESALFNILSKDKMIRLRIVGHLFTGLLNSKVNDQIERFGLHNYIDLQRLISECDICLIPLVENEFTNCKSELKYFEAGIVKVPSIASPTFIYKKVISDQINGLLAADTEWESKINLLIKDEQLREKIGKNAYDHCMENYYGAKVKKILVDNLNSMLEIGVK